MSTPIAKEARIMMVYTQIVLKKAIHTEAQQC